MQSLLSNTKRVQRILVCQLRQIGDVLLSTPALQLLKERFPEAEIHVLTEKKCVAMLEHNPHVHTVWALDKKAFPSFFHELRWYWSIARQQFNLVVDFQQLPRTRWVSMFSQAPVRLTFSPPWYNRWIYTDWVAMQGGYASKAKASILQPLGIHWNGEKPRLYLDATERANAKAMLSSLGLTSEHRLITVDPTHRRITRCWPARHYAKFFDLAYEQDASLRFLPFWGPDEEDDIRAMIALCCHPEAIVLPPKMLSLREMAACIHEAALHIGNCSAPRHIAVAVDTPTFVILGATGSAWTFPSPEHRDFAAQMPCRPCNRIKCAHRDCLEKLSAEQVLPAFFEHLETYASGA